MPLAQFFLNKFNNRYNVPHFFSQDTLDVLIRYPWPGNVREIEHLVERLVITVQEMKILPKHLPKKFLQENVNDVISLPNIVPLDLIEKELIIKATNS